MEISKEIADRFNEHASSYLEREVRANWINDNGRVMPKLDDLVPRRTQEYADLLIYYESLLKMNCYYKVDYRYIENSKLPEANTFYCISEKELNRQQIRDKIKQFRHIDLQIRFDILIDQITVLGEEQYKLETIPDNL